MAKTDSIIPLGDEGKAETLIEWAQANSKRLSIGGIAVAAVAASVFLWRASVDKKEMRASQALASAQMVVQSGNAALAQSDLQAVIRRYGSTKAGTNARLLLAQVLFSQGKTDEGLRELEAIGSGGPHAVSVHALKGAGLEQAGKPAEAAAEYERAAAGATTDLAKASYQADAARSYRAAGNNDAARRLWDAMAKDESNPLAGEAKVRLGELNAKAAG